MLFTSKAKEEFNIEPITSDEVQRLIDRCVRIYQGHPDWVDPDDHIKTINFAKSICEETARLVTLAIGIKIDGSARAAWLQAKIDEIYFNLRHWVEYGYACGTVVLKPNGQTIDLYTPDCFIVTEQRNGDITGIVFINKEKDSSGKKYYTRLEYHRFLKSKITTNIFGKSTVFGKYAIYAISNKCYIGSSENDLGKSIEIEKTPWAGLAEEVAIANVNKPLFGVLRTPHANNIDINSPLSLPIFSDAIEEFKDLDIAYSRNAKEIFDSKRMVLLDSDRLIPTGGQVQNSALAFEASRKNFGLPDYVKNVFGDGQQTFYEEVNPSLNTDIRLVGINTLLSQIGYKCGFSNGYFVFNEKSGNVTATQIEADQQRTIQFIKDCRDKLESCLDGTIYALNIFADLYGYAPVGDYEVTYDFGDITYNREEDRARWYGYAVSGKVPFWYFLQKFEGLTEEEAKALEKEAAPKTGSLFEKIPQE